MFQVQQEIIEDPQAEKRQKIYAKSNITNFLHLLSNEKSNHNWAVVREIVQQMHNRFILKEQFWIREIEDIANKCQQNSQQPISILLEWINMAFEHGDYLELAKHISKLIIKLYKSNIVNFTQAESKLQLLISLFWWDIKNGQYFFGKARKLCKAAQKDDKLRSLFQRQIKLPFQGFDVTFDEYKNWQKNEDQLKKTQVVYDRVKIQAEQMIESLQIGDFSKLSPEARLHMLQQNDEIDQKQYLQALKQVPVNKRLLNLKRRSKKGQFMMEYLKQLEANADEVLLNQQFQRILRQQQQTNIFTIKVLFLNILVKRINKHLINTQSQQYLDQWGNKVVYLREQIAAIIAKSSKHEQTQFLYQYWFDIEANVIKDKQAVLSIFHSLPKDTFSHRLYKHIADKLIGLGSIVDARKILRSGLTQSKSKEQCKLQYVYFELVYGNTSLIEESETISILAQQKLYKNLKRSKQTLIQDDEISKKIQQQQKKRIHIDSNKTIYLRGFPIDWNQKRILQLFKKKEDILQVRIVRDKITNKSRGFAYVDFSSSETAQYECQNNTSQVQMAISKPPTKYSDDQKTIFLGGLPATATQQKIIQLFQQYANAIKDVRLIKDEQGAKGYCYVQCNSLEEKQQAFQFLKNKKKLKIDKKSIILAECDSDRNKSKVFIPVVFIKNLAFRAREQDLINFFKSKQITGIKNIEIPKDQKNKARGIAYVQFSTFKDYTSAKDLKTGNILGRDFEILQSDRNITKKNQMAKDNNEFRKFL